MPQELSTIEEERAANLNQARFQAEQEREQENEENDEETPVQNNKPKINNATAFLMIGTAAAIDGLQAFLEWIVIGFYINWLIDIGTWGLFFWWFKSKGVSFMNVQKALVFNGLALLEIIPAIDELPLWTLDILLMLAIVKAEDKMAKISQNMV